MGYTLYKRLRRLLFRLKRIDITQKNDAPCIHCIKSNASLSKYSQPIKEHGNFYSTRPHTRNEDFISSDEEKD